MVERTPPTNAEIVDVLRLAIVAAGEMSDLPSWRGRLAALIPEVVATISEGSREYRQVHDMMTAVVLSAEFLGFELQDRSHRCKVVIMADYSKKGEPEHVWSERTDTKLGAAQLAILKTLKKGNKVLVWKSTEKIDDERKVRMLNHIARLDATTPVPQASPAPQTPSPQPESAPPAETRPAESPTGTAPVGEQSSNIPPPDLHEALERLSGKERVAVIRWAKEQGIANVYGADLLPEQTNSILSYMELMKQGMT